MKTKHISNPVVTCLQFRSCDILTTSSIIKGNDIIPGQNYQGDAPVRMDYYDYDDEYDY